MPYRDSYAHQDKLFPVLPHTTTDSLSTELSTLVIRLLALLWLGWSIPTVRIPSTNRWARFRYRYIWIAGQVILVNGGKQYRCPQSQTITRSVRARSMAHVSSFQSRLHSLYDLWANLLFVSGRASSQFLLIVSLLWLPNSNCCTCMHTHYNELYCGSYTTERWDPDLTNSSSLLSLGEKTAFSKSGENLLLFQQGLKAL